MEHAHSFESEPVPDDDIDIRLRRIPQELTDEINANDIDTVLAVAGIVLTSGPVGYQVALRMAASAKDAAICLALATKVFVEQVGDVDTEELLECLGDFLFHVQAEPEGDDDD